MYKWNGFIARYLLWWKMHLYNLCSLWDPSPSSQQWDDFIDLKYNLRFHEFLESDIQQLLNWIQENIAFWGICLLWRFTKGGLIFAMKTRISGNFYILHRLQKKLITTKKAIGMMGNWPQCWSLLGPLPFLDHCLLCLIVLHLDCHLFQRRGYVIYIFHKNLLDWYLKPM